MTRTFIVVPCFNEERRLPVHEFTAFLGANSDVSFVFVDDGSSDGTSTVLAGLVATGGGRVHARRQSRNAGKAEAVRVGVQYALGQGARYVGYFDADLATPLDVVPLFVALLDTRADISFVMGARVALLGRFIARRPLRHYLGRVFATGASAVLGLPIYDTQCGAKLFRVDAQLPALFDTPFVSRWVFDVELIARHLARHGGDSRRIYELPLERWTDVGESKVRPEDFLRAVGELAKIYRMYRLPGSVSGLLGMLSAPFVRYVGVGGLGTIVHYAILTLLVELTSARPEVATVAGALAGALVNYLLNYHLTFASVASHKHTLPRFLAVALLGTGVNALGMWLLSQKLGVHYLLAQLGCTGAVLVLGYLLNKVWTFRQTAPLPAEHVSDSVGALSSGDPEKAVRSSADV